MHSFRGTAIWSYNFWFGSPCTTKEVGGTFEALFFFFFFSSQNKLLDWSCQKSLNEGYYTSIAIGSKSASERDKTFFLALNERKLKSCVRLQQTARQKRGKYGTKAYCLEDVVCVVLERRGLFESDGSMGLNVVYSLMVGPYPYFSRFACHLIGELLDWTFRFIS